MPFLQGELEDITAEQASTSSSPEYSLEREAPAQNFDSDVTYLTPDPNLRECEIVPARRAMLPFELLKFKIAQRRYNQLIWKNIKKRFHVLSTKTP